MALQSCETELGAKAVAHQWYENYVLSEKLMKVGPAPTMNVDAEYG